MSEDVTVIVDGNDVSEDALGLSTTPNSLVDGHQSFTVLLINTDGKYNNYFSAQQDVTLKVDDVDIFKGYLDSGQYIYLGAFGPEKGQPSCMVRLFGRGYSQDLSNLRYTGSHGATEKAASIISAMLTSKSSEIIYTPPTPDTTPTVGGLEPRDEYLLPLIQEIMERCDYEGYVGLDYTLHFFPIGTVSSGIVIGDSDIIQADYIPFDALDLRQTLDLYGARTKVLPAGEDAWTDGSYDSQPDQQDTPSLTYVPLYSKTFDPDAAEYVNCFWLNFKYKCAVGNAFYKVTWQVEGGSEITKDEVNFSNTGWMDASYQLQKDVASSANWAAGKDVTVTIYMKVVGGDVASLKDVTLGYNVELAGWEAIGIAREMVSPQKVEGNWCIKSQSSSDYTFYPVSVRFLGYPVNLRFPEHTYENLKFTLYVDCNKDLDYLEARLYSGTGLTDWFYKRVPVNKGTYQDFSLPLGVNTGWTTSGDPDWTDIRRLRVLIKTQGDLNYATWTTYADHLRFSEAPVHYSTSDPDSQKAYRPREYVEYLGNASLEEITKRGDSLLDKNKDPLRTIHLVVPATKGLIDDTWNWIGGLTLRLDCADLGIDSEGSDNYRMISVNVTRSLDSVIAGHKFIAEVQCVELSRKLEAKRLRQIASPEAATMIG